MKYLPNATGDFILIPFGFGRSTTIGTFKLYKISNTLNINEKRLPAILTILVKKKITRKKI